MTAWLARLRQLVAPLAPTHTAGGRSTTDEHLALGVLLWVVAEADGRFLDAEQELIRQVLTTTAGVDQEDMAVVLAAVKEAARERIDLYAFTREVASDVGGPGRAAIVRQLFRVACADGGLDAREIETIRQIAGLLHVPHAAFIQAKLDAKAEFGITSAG